MKLQSTFCHSDPGGRAENEDAYAVSCQPRHLVMTVADGLGGQGDGAAASRLAVRQLCTCGSDGLLPDEAQLLQAFEEANAAILKEQRNSRHMKTTAVYLCVSEDKAIWGHIGDSRLYHFFNGKMVEYTLDHSVSQMAVLLGDITHEQIPGHPDRSRLLRALGCEQIEPSIRHTVPLEPGLHPSRLCTDGFWEYVPEALMEETLAQGQDAEAWGEAMCAYLETHCRPGHDNCTALAACIEVEQKGW